MKETDALHHPGQLTRQIAESLSRGECVALATLIARSGSGPREAGASMLVMGTAAPWGPSAVGSWRRRRSRSPGRSSAPAGLPAGLFRSRRRSWRPAG